MAFEDLLHPFQAGFSHGEVSPEVYGRVDLQAYGSALRTSRNAFIRTEGSWQNRPGMEFCANSVSDTPKGSILIPFTFNVGQSYILELGAGTLQVFSLGALIEAGTTPYSIADLKTIRWSQSADTLTIVHNKHPPYEFKRSDATTFTFLPGVYHNGPFLQENTDETNYIWSDAISGAVTLTASNPMTFSAGMVGGLFQLTQQDLSQIQPWEAINRINPQTGHIVGILGHRTRSNGKNYICVGYPGYDPGGGNDAIAITTGSVAPDHDRGTQADGNGHNIAGASIDAAGVLWQYTDSGFGVVLITQFISDTVVVGTVQSNYDGGPGLLPLAVVGGPVAAASGPWNFLGDGSTMTFVLSGSVSTDPNKFLVTVNGKYAVRSTFSITAGNLTFIAPPNNNDVIVATEIKSLGQTTLWNAGAFSDDQGYPSAVTYYPDRLVFAATTKQPVGVFASETSDYHDFRVSNPVVNSDAFTVYLNARQLNSISDLCPLQDLIIGTANITWRLWAGPTGTALGPLSIEAKPQAFLGASPNCPSVLYGDSMLYTIYGGRRIRDLVYQFQFDKYTGSELTAYSRHLVPFGTEIVEMMYKPEPFGLLYALRSDGILLVCTYVRDQQMIAWSRWDTQGLIDDIAVVPENNSYALYAVTQRTIQGATQRYVERLSQLETTTPLDYRFLDCSLTYDGRNTSTTTMNVVLLPLATDWSSGNVGIITASSIAGWAGFVASDPVHRNQIQLFDSTGAMARVELIAYLTTSTARVRFVDPIPVTLRGISVTTWTFARTQFAGITHLVGQTVSVLADANFVGGTDGTPTLVVDNLGTLILPYAAGVVCAGLQYFSDMETLPLNAQGQETIRERAKGFPHVYLDVTNARGVMVGSDFENMSPIKERAFEPYLKPTNLQDGIINSLIYSDFDSEAHVCVRQPFPLPVTIRMVIPEVNVGEPVG